MRAFTRAELLGCCAGLAAILFVLVPSQARSAGNVSLATCMSNLGRLTQAWQMFAESHDGLLPWNPNGVEAQQPATGSTNLSWASGWLGWDLSPDNTNAIKLSEAALGPFLQRNTRVFKCPSDTFMSQVQQSRRVPMRPRSYSMNHFVGRSRANGIFPGWQYFQRLQDIRGLKPDQLFLIIEEHPDSINDPMFVVDPESPRWVDYPASFHNNGASLSFADGHVEHKIWVEPETVPPVTFRFPATAPRQPALDYHWLRARATIRMGQ